MRVVLCATHGGASRRMTTIRDCSSRNDDRVCQWRLCDAVPVDDYPFAVSSDMLSYFPKCDCREAGKWGATGQMPPGHTWVYHWTGGFLAHVDEKLQAWLDGEKGTQV